MNTLSDDAGELPTVPWPGRRIYRNAEYLSVTLAVDEEKIAHWLPNGIRLAQPARADLFCAYFPEHGLGTPYREIGVFIHVKTALGTGIHCPWMVVDDDRALITGREFLGYPKKYAQITWKQEGNHLYAEGSRRGNDLVAMSASIGEVITPSRPFLGRAHRNIKGALGAPARLIGFKPDETTVEMRSVDVALSIGGGASDPLDRMGLGQQIEAHLHRVHLAPGLMPPIPMGLPSPLSMLRLHNIRTL